MLNDLVTPSNRPSSFVRARAVTFAFALVAVGCGSSGGAGNGAATGGTMGGAGVPGSGGRPGGGTGGDNSAAGRGGSTSPAGTGGVAMTGGTSGAPGGGGSGGTGPRDGMAADSVNGDTDSASAPDATPGTGKTFVYVSGFSPPISTLSFDAAKGTITPLSMVVSTPNDGEPSFMTFSPDKKTLYSIDEQMGKPLSRVIAYRVNSTTGALQEINRESTRTSVSAHVAVHQSGKWVLVANYGGGSISVFPVRDDGGLMPSMPPVPSGGQTHQIVFDSTGKNVFVPCLTARHIALFTFADGVLTPRNPPTVPITGGPRHISFTPDERFAYVITQGESTIVAFTHDKTTGLLTPLETVKSTDAGTLSAHIEVHKSGKFLYTTNRRDNSVGMFSIDQTTGKLTRIGLYREMLQAPRLFGIDPSGQFMIVASQDSAQLLLHKIDQTTGMLQRIGNPVSVPGEPTFVKIIDLP